MRLINRVTSAGLPVGDYEADVMASSPSAVPAATRYQVRLSVRPPHEAAMEPNVEPGLRYEYCEAGKLDRWSDFSKLPVAGHGVCPVPQLDVPRRQADFALRFLGYFKAPRDGEYTFSAYVPLPYGSAWWGNAGIRLSVDSERLIDRSDWPYYLEKGSIWLRQGLHPITVVYYQRRGPLVLHLSVAPPDQPARAFEPGDFVHAAEKR